MEETLLRIFEKGGLPLFMAFALYAIAKFGLQRFISALEGVSKTQTESMTAITAAIQTSNVATVQAMGTLTERIARMEGRVDTLGDLAIRQVPEAMKDIAQQTPRRTAAISAALVESVVEVFDEDGKTPIGPVPNEIAPERSNRTLHPKPARRTPPKGVGVYSLPPIKKG